MNHYETWESVVISTDFRAHEGEVNRGDERVLGRWCKLQKCRRILVILVDFSIRKQLWSRHTLRRGRHIRWHIKVEEGVHWWTTSYTEHAIRKTVGGCYRRMQCGKHQVTTTTDSGTKIQFKIYTLLIPEGNCLNYQSSQASRHQLRLYRFKCSINFKQVTDNSLSLQSMYCINSRILFSCNCTD